MASTLLSLAVGLGVFLYGMRQLQINLQRLGSVKIKRWLGRATNNPLSSVFSGTVVTAVLQSSSMVSLLVLAFASAGMIPLFNAVGVILGANLGTTFTGWIVATLGFKLDLAVFALPLFGVGALCQVFSDSGTKRYAIFGLGLGIGLLLIGLGQMKSAVEGLPGVISPEFLSQLNAPLYLLFGLVMTAVIQSSSAMTLIALTALSGGVIDLTSAAALIVGADIGTTSTTAIGSIRSSAIAKQLALSHVIYNLCVDALAFLVLIPLLPFALEYFGITDPIYGLVLFHSAFNLIGLFIFVPFLKPYSRWLSHFFNKGPAEIDSLSVHTSVVPETALLSLLAALDDVIARVLSLNLNSLKGGDQSLADACEGADKLAVYFNSDVPFLERYLTAKSREAEIHHYIASSSLENSDNDYSQVLSEITTATRYAIYSSKTLKDARPDLGLLSQLKELDPEILGSVFPDKIDIIYKGFCEVLLENCEKKEAFDLLNLLKVENEKLHNLMHETILRAAGQKRQKRLDLATLLNTNRELWHANVNLINSLEHLVKARALGEQSRRSKL
jgi:phosphate:Na+ symporter